MDSINTRDILDDRSKYIDTQVQIVGHVLVNSAKIVMVDIPQKESIQIEIICDKFEEKLLDKVPCYLGGEYTFSDKMMIAGTLVAENALLKLTQIVSVVVIRGSEEFVVNF